MEDDRTQRYADAVKVARAGGLTDESIRAIRDSLPQGTNRVEIRDTTVEGLYIRIGHRKQTWMLSSDEGKNPIGEWGAGPADMSTWKARERAVAVLAKVPGKAKSGTFGEVLDQYIKLRLPAHAATTQRDWAWRIKKYIRPALNDSPIDNPLAFRADARKMLDAQTARPAMHNKLLMITGRIARWAIGRDIVPSSINLIGFEGIGIAPRGRLWSDEEMVALLRRVDALPIGWRCFWTVILHCGFRVGTARDLEWSWYDKSKKVFLIPSTGTKGRAEEARAIAFPVVGAVVDALGLQDKITGGQTFINGNPETGTKWKSIQKSMWKLREAVPDFRPHDVRRYLRSTLSQVGVSVDTGERVLLHKLGGIRGVYDMWAYTDQIRGALEQFEAYLDGILIDARHRRSAERQEARAEGEYHDDREE